MFILFYRFKNLKIYIYYTNYNKITNSMSDYFNNIKEYIDTNIIDTISLYIDDVNYLQDVKKQTYNNVCEIYKNIHNSDNNLVNISHDYCIKSIVDQYFDIVISKLKIIILEQIN